MVLASVAAAVAEDELDLQIVSFLSVCLARNALFSAITSDSLESVSLQLLPSLLQMCQDSVSSSASDASVAALKHFLICDLTAAIVPISDIRMSITGFIKEFTRGNFLLAACRWLLAACCLPLAACRLLLAACRLLLAACCLTLAACCRRLFE